MPASFDGSTGLTFPDGTVLGTSPAGFKNRIINGDMRIDQRNAGAAVTVGASATYAVDRFKATNTTGTGTITAQQSTLSGSKSLKITATAAVTTLTAGNQVQAVVQVVESQNIADLNSKSVTISFKVETNWSGNLPLAIRGNSNTRSYVIDRAVTAGITSISITLPFETATVAANDNTLGIEIYIGHNNEGSLQTATTGAWIAGTFLGSTASTQWTKTLNNFINITEVQLEAGSVATPFERRPSGLELALCQRYLPAFSPGAINNSAPGTGAGVAGGAASFNYVFNVETRVPITGVSSPAISNFSLSRPSTGTIVCTGLAFSQASTKSCQIQFNVTSGVVADVPYFLTSNAAAAQLLFTGAEL